jgi:hypothetical protein
VIAHRCNGDDANVEAVCSYSEAVEEDLIRDFVWSQ